ncbi:response regulator [Cohnella faecalis]|uniref:Response regulator n=1 Tax=Cohnella faecalis TaxID=2315694 RepID=A0A398CSZ0_9BACL|nr:response regulator [Cohnella faecalis]RIE02937.1 response regulator [Cohnella faecalis]
MFNVVIVEDEKPILELMKVVIGKNPLYNIVGAFSNPLEALAHLPALQPDVAFLDVEMPKLGGMELARKIGECCERTRIIFATAHKEYALEAFNVYAFDYILKPVTPAAVERIAARLTKLDRPISAPAAVKAARQVSLSCFGGFEVRNAQDELIHWPTRKTEELFAYFLCYSNQDVGKWRLADDLWPEMAEERAASNLYNTIYRLKKTVQSQEIGMDIVKTNDGYMLKTLHADYDLLEFQRAVSALKNEAEDIAELERLCSLYRGPLLEHKDYMWKIQLEAGYDKQYRKLALQLIRLYMSGEEWSKAERQIDICLTAYPLNEDMHGLLIDIYAASGRKERIAAHYVGFKAHYREELGIDPPAELSGKVAAYLN